MPIKFVRRRYYFASNSFSTLADCFTATLALNLPLSPFRIVHTHVVRWECFNKWTFNQFGRYNNQIWLYLHIFWLIIFIHLLNHTNRFFLSFSWFQADNVASLCAKSDETCQQQTETVNTLVDSKWQHPTATGQANTFSNDDDDDDVDYCRRDSIRQTASHSRGRSWSPSRHWTAPRAQWIQHWGGRFRIRLATFWNTSRTLMLNEIRLLILLGFGLLFISKFWRIKVLEKNNIEESSFSPFITIWIASETQVWVQPPRFAAGNTSEPARSDESAETAVVQDAQDWNWADGRLEWGKQEQTGGREEDGHHSGERQERGVSWLAGGRTTQSSRTWGSSMKEDIVNVTFYFLLCLISMLFSFPRTSKFKPFTILSGSFLKAIISEFMLPNQNLFSLFFFSGNLILPCFSFKYFGVVICRFQNGQIFRGKNRCHYHFEGLQKSNYLLPGLSFKLSLQLFFPL